MSGMIVSTKNAPAAVGPYSQAVVTGGMVFCSGQVAIDPVTGRIEGGIKEQTDQCLKNLRAVLEAAGASMASVVKVSVFLKDMSKLIEVNEVYAGFFSEWQPARTCVEVSRLPKDALVEIDAIAALPRSQ